MIQIEDNLLPKTILSARRVRIRTRTWSVVGTVGVVLFIGIDLAARILIPGPLESELHAYAELGERESALKAEHAVHAKNLSEVQRRVTITKRITTRPDWGILLAAVSEKRADHVVLTAFHVEETEQSAGVRVVLSGMGLTQSGIQQFVLELEATGLFDRVTLLETRRTISPGGERLAFNVHADITTAGLSRSISGPLTTEPLLEVGGVQ